MNQNRLNDTAEVVRRCAANESVAPFARIVGRWVWCEFDTKPSVEVLHWLKAEGFHYSGRRRAWQHPCGYFSKPSSRDPRAYYGEEPLSEFERELQQESYREQGVL